ncbi:MAG: hypothetical protein QM765_48735 [Myxococcales bacterium]
MGKKMTAKAMIWTSAAFSLWLYCGSRWKDPTASPATYSGVEQRTATNSARSEKSAT